MFHFISICVILFLGFLLFLDWIWHSYNQTRLLPVSDDNGTTTNNCIADDVNLSLEDRVELYKKTFDTNGNQLILTNEHIVTNMIPGREGEETNNINESTTAIDIELGDDNNGNNSDNANNNVKEDDADVDDQPDYCSGSTTITKSLCLDHTTKADKKPMVNGTCIICFEEFKKDEVIVWSEDANCHHIYHQECMVTYLASNSLRNDTTGSGSSILNVTNNPCPTCRRHSYCIVRNEDLLPSITTTATTTTTNQIMAVVDSPLEETVSSSTTVGSNNNSSTNNVTSTIAAIATATATATATTTTTTTTTTNNITMITNNEIVTASNPPSATVSMTIATVTAAVNEEIAAGIGLRGVVDDR